MQSQIKCRMYNFLEKFYLPYVHLNTKNERNCVNISTKIDYSFKVKQNWYVCFINWLLKNCFNMINCVGLTKGYKMNALHMSIKFSALQDNLLSLLSIQLIRL